MEEVDVKYGSGIYSKIKSEPQSEEDFDSAYFTEEHIKVGFRCPNASKSYLAIIHYRVTYISIICC